MRKLAVLIAACGATLLAPPVLGQTSAGDRQQRPAPSEASRAGADAGAAAPSGSEARSPGAPLDRGPHTPEANQAHRGGGVVMEGAPGAPAPAPQPTPRLDRGATR